MQCKIKLYTCVGNAEIKPFVTSVNLWHTMAFEQTRHNRWPCKGKWVRLTCIYGLGDLPWLYDRVELFANKFYIDYQWLAFDCMEELAFNRTFVIDKQ